LEQPSIAQRLLDALPSDHALTEEDTALIGALVGGRATWSWSTQNGVFSGALIGAAPVHTVADLRRELAALPESDPDADDTNGFATVAKVIIDHVETMLRPVMDQVVVLRTRLDSLIEMLEERHVVDTTERAARSRQHYERDYLPMIDSLHVRTPEQDVAFGERHADWIARSTAASRDRLGAELHDELRREVDAMNARMRAISEPKDRSVE